MILFIGDVDRSMRDREGFQEIDFPAFFAPIAKWSARIDDASRIPEYIARAWSTAISGRPGPVVLALPEDMLHEDGIAAPRRPAVVRPAQAPCPDAMATMMQMIGDAAAPVAIVGGAGWNARTRALLHRNLPSVSACPSPRLSGGRMRSHRIPAVYAGNLGYGPNPKLVERVKAADLLLVVGARLGEATTDGYELVTPDHPDQLLIHVHPDPEELGRVYRADLAICADMAEFAESAALWDDGDVIDFDAGPRRMPNGSNGTRRATTRISISTWRWRWPHAVALLPDGCDHLQRCGQFCRLVASLLALRGFPLATGAHCGAMGYGVPAGVAAALRFPERCVVAVAGDGDFLMNGQELATAAQYGLDLLVIVVDNSTYGTIRMHQEREYPGREASTHLANPDFAKLAESFGGWGARVTSNAEFDSALEQAMARKGIRLLHCITDIEQLSAAGATVSGLRKS